MIIYIFYFCLKDTCISLKNRRQNNLRSFLSSIGCKLSLVILLTAVHNAYTYISPFPNVTGDSQLPYPWGWKLEGGGVGDGNWREGGVGSWMQRVRVDFSGEMHRRGKGFEGCFILVSWLVKALL